MIKIRNILSNLVKRKNVGIPFIYGFHILILWCAFQKVLDYTNPLGNIALYAYYSLTIGVILQIILRAREPVRAGADNTGHIMAIYEFDDLRARAFEKA